MNNVMMNELVNSSTGNMIVDFYVNAKQQQLLMKWVFKGNQLRYEYRDDGSIEVYSKYKGSNKEVLVTVIEAALAVQGAC